MRTSPAPHRSISAGLATLGLAAALAVMTGCSAISLPSSGSTPETLVLSPTAQATAPTLVPTPAAAVTPYALTPEMAETPSPFPTGSVTVVVETPTAGTATPAATDTTTTTSTPAITDTPAATDTPAPSTSLAPDVEDLLKQLDTFEAAVKSGDSQAMLARQRDLLNAADQTAHDLSDDHSSVADQVRSALAAVRDGARGDMGRLGEARRALEQVSGVATPTVASSSSSASGTPVPSVAQATSSLRQSLDAFRAAVRDGRSDQLLPAQQQLLKDLDAADQAAQSASSGQADQLRSAVADIRNALGGNYALLDTAAAKLGEDNGTPAASGSQASEQQLQQAGQDLAQKVSAFGQAVQAGDTQKALSQQQEAMRSLSSLEQSLQGSDSKLAHDLKDATDSLRQGLNGDQGKLTEGEQKLANALGQQSPNGSPTSAVAPQAVVDASRQLSDKLNALEQAQASGDTSRAMQAQQDVADQIARAEASIQGDNSDAAVQLRSTLEDLKGGLAGDQAKLQSARTKLLSMSNR